MAGDISLTLLEATDIDDGVIRLDLPDMRMLGVMPGDYVSVEGARKIYLQAHPAYAGDRNQRITRVSPLAALNVGLKSGQTVRVYSERFKPPVAELVTLQAEDDVDQLHMLARCKSIANFWNKRVVQVDDELRVPTLDAFPLHVKVVSMQPHGAAQITRGTEFSVAVRKIAADVVPLGGLRDVYRTCQSLVLSRFVKGLPVKVRSILLSGPVGCGKARLVKRLAHENNLELHELDVHQLVDKAQSQGGLDISALLPELGRRGRTILMLNHLDALKNKMALSPALGAMAHSILSQLCLLLEELPMQPNVLVFGIAAGEFEPNLFNNHRFDVHIPVDAPNRWSREELLTLSTDTLELHEDVNVSVLAELTAGMTGQDIEHLSKTAEMIAMGAKVHAGDFMAALRSIKPSASAEVMCDIPSTLWEEVAGLDDIKQLMRETIMWTLRQSDRFAESGVRPPRSILLSGGQGTGKTSLVRALAAQMPMNLIEIGCSFLMARQPVDGARLLHDAFGLARRKAPCVLFLDEVDALFESFGTTIEPSTFQHPIVAQLIAELDSLSSLLGVIVIAATNRPDRLTEDVLRPGRFDFAITLPLPDLAARKKVLHIHARKLPLAADVDFDRLAANTSGLSPAEIANLCNRVGLMALRQSLSGQDGGLLPVVTPDLFEQALRGRKN